MWPTNTVTGTNHRPKLSQNGDMLWYGIWVGTGYKRTNPAMQKSRWAETSWGNWGCCVARLDSGVGWHLETQSNAKSPSWYRYRKKFNYEIKTVQLYEHFWKRRGGDKVCRLLGYESKGCNCQPALRKIQTRYEITLHHPVPWNVDIMS